MMNYAAVFLLASHQHAWPKEASDLVLGIVCSECEGNPSRSRSCDACAYEGYFMLSKQDALRGEELGLWRITKPSILLHAVLPQSHYHSVDQVDSDIVDVSRELQIAAREYYHAIKMVESLLDK